MPGFVASKYQAALRLAGRFSGFISSSLSRLDQQADEVGRPELEKLREQWVRHLVQMWGQDVGHELVSRYLADASTKGREEFSSRQTELTQYVRPDLDPSEQALMFFSCIQMFSDWAYLEEMSARIARWKTQLEIYRQNDLEDGSK